MAEEERFNGSDSDSEEDADYVPSDAASVSEEEHSGDEEAATAENSETTSKKRKKKVKPSSRKRKGGIKLEDEVEDASENEEKAEEEIVEKSSEEKVKEEKANADKLWADFLSDVGPIAKKSKPVANSGNDSQTPSKSTEVAKPKIPEKVKVTKIFDFAGETVEVTKEVAADSKEAQLQEDKTEEASTATPSATGVKKSGLGNLIGKITNKKSKMSTLVKTQLDWNQYKQKEGIEEELATHNRGKDGYIQKLDFLARTDHKQFEIEKNLRAKSRNNNR